MLSESQRYEHECHNKRPYPGKPDAKRALRRHLAGGGIGLHAYRCCFCGDWHVGHTNKNRWEFGDAPDAA